MVDRLGLPLMLKPDQGGSALGAQMVPDAAELPAAMVGCLAYADTVLAERFVAGTEVAVAVVDDGDEPRALPPVEIEVRSAASTTTRRATRRERPPSTARRGSGADRCCKALERRRWPRTSCSACGTCPGPTRSWRRPGEVQILEMNVSPGLTETSLLPTAVTAAGQDLAEVYRALIEKAAARGE